VFDPSTFNVIDLVLADAGGALDLSSGGQLIGGNNGFSFSYSFESEYDYVIPYFALFDLDFQPGNSDVRIDGLAIAGPVQPVSEPNSLLLMLLGVTAGFAFQRRNRT
jgi:hypothetical protein